MSHEETREKKLAQVCKLLELAKSSNVNEASNAAAQAQKLMSQFSITEAMIEIEAATPETEEPVGEDLLHKHGTSTMPTWKINLAGGMARANQCRIVIGGNTLRIVGRSGDADAVRYLFSYVCREIDRLTKKEAELRGRPGRTWCNNFRLGAASEVTNRLHQAAKEARREARQEANHEDTLGTGTALALTNNALARIEDRDKAAQGFIEERYTRSHRSSSSRFDLDGRKAGRRAGGGINLESANGRLDSGNHKALGKGR